MEVSQILLAIPSAKKSQIRAIMEKLSAFSVGVRILPGLSELAQGRVQVSDIRDVNIEDLLGRDTVAPDARLLERNIRLYGGFR